MLGGKQAVMRGRVWRAHRNGKGGSVAEALNPCCDYSWIGNCEQRITDLERTKENDQAEGDSNALNTWIYFTRGRKKYSR